MILTSIEGRLGLGEPDTSGRKWRMTVFQTDATIIDICHNGLALIMRQQFFNIRSVRSYESITSLPPPPPTLLLPFPHPPSPTSTFLNPHPPSLPLPPSSILILRRSLPFRSSPDLEGEEAVRGPSGGNSSCARRRRGQGQTTEQTQGQTRSHHRRCRREVDGPRRATGVRVLNDR